MSDEKDGVIVVGGKLGDGRYEARLCLSGFRVEAATQDEANAIVMRQFVAWFLEKVATPATGRPNTGHEHVGRPVGDSRLDATDGPDSSRPGDVRHRG